MKPLTTKILCPLWASNRGELGAVGPHTNTSVR